MPKTNQPKLQRFSADEIVRAIEAVEQAGLAVRCVEITNSGSIKIELRQVKSAPRLRRKASAKCQCTARQYDEGHWPKVHFPQRLIEASFLSSS